MTSKQLQGDYLTGSCAHFFAALPGKLREDDKRKHIVLSFWLTLLALYFVPTLTAFVLVFLVGLAKECWDHFYGSGFCLFDMVGNLLGSTFALLLAFVMQWMFHW